MDIYEFVNSNDIREHLKKIGYRFNSLEAAWLIYQCTGATIAEKHEAWRELIDTMPDCAVPERRNTEPQESLHAFLEKYMALEDAYVEEFKKDDPEGKYVYTASVRYESGLDPDYRREIYSNFSGLRKSCEFEEPDDVVSITVDKREKDSENGGMSVVFDYLFMDIYSIHPWSYGKGEYEIFGGVFDGLWFEFPTPFEKGDILFIPKRPGGRSGWDPFVLTGVLFDGVESERVKANVRADGDFTDMFAGGLFANDDGKVYRRTVSSYMDMEYYTEELKGTAKVLVPISAFVKGRIDAMLLAMAYHKVLSEAYSSGFEILQKGDRVRAGLEEPDHAKIWFDRETRAPEGYVPCLTAKEVKWMISSLETEGAVVDVIDCGADVCELMDMLAESKTRYPIKLHAEDPAVREAFERATERYGSANAPKGEADGDDQPL